MNKIMTGYIFSAINILPGAALQTTGCFSMVYFYKMNAILC